MNKRCIYNGTHKTKAVAVTSVIPDKKDEIIAVLKQRLEDDDKEMNKKNVKNGIDGMKVNGYGKN